MLGDLLLPPGDGGGVGEVEVGTGAVPELHGGGLAVGVFHQQVGLLRSSKLRVVAQQGGLDVGHQAHAVVEVTLHKGGGVGELVVVPVEDVTPGADGGVARRQVERVAGDVVFGATGDELTHTLLRVGRVGVRHGRARITQRKTWREDGRAGQPGVAAGDGGGVGTGDVVQVEVTMVGHKVAVVAVVVVHLAAHVEAAVGQGVVEQAKPYVRQAFVLLARFAGDVERDVFVQRVGPARVVTHGVQVLHAVTLAGAVGVARAFAQAEVHLATLALQVVVDLLVPPAEVVGLGGAVCRRGAPCALVLAFPAAEETLQCDGEAHVAGGDLQLFGVVCQRKRGQREAAHVEAVTPFHGQVAQARRHRPAAGHLQLALRQHQHTHDVFFQHPDMGDSAAGAVQDDVVALVGLEGEVGSLIETHGGSAGLTV